MTISTPANPPGMRFLTSVLLLLTALAAWAQPAPLDTRGREFWLGFMQNASGTQQLSVKIAAEQATTGTVSVPLAGWSAPFSVTANGVVTVSVPNLYEATGSETVLDRGVYITAVEPVTVTAVNYQNQTTDAAQVLPKVSLGTSYRVDALPGTSTAFQNGQYIFRSEFLIVATEDGTEVSITPSAATTAGHAPGVPFTVQLNAGQVYQIQAISGLTDFTGTLVSGTDQSGPCRPFAVFGGSMCAVMNCAACDHVNEQMTPLSTWGTSFHTVPMGNLAAWGFRIQANENNTAVSIDGGAPILLAAGATHMVASTTQPACITSDKPISVAQFMVGATCAGSGDPSLLLLSADERLSTSATFTTLFSTQVGISHFVSVVTPTSAVGQLMLDGAPVAPAVFSTFPGCAGLSYAKVLVPAGAHQVTSATGFVAYAYGLASGESYLYALSNNMAVPAPQDSVICSSGPITLTAPIPLANAQWTTASDPGTVIATGNSFTFTPDHNDVYRVDGEILPSGCTRHFEFNVGVPVQPQLDLTANASPGTSVCQYSPVQLNTGTVPNADWFDLNWSPSAELSDPSIPNPVAYPSQTTWFRLQVSSPVGCGSAMDSVLVQVQPSNIFGVRTTVADDSICAGNATALHAEVERVLYADAFEGVPAAWWAAVQGASTSSACGSVTGSALYFNGAATRSATTPPMTIATGGVAHFALKIASGAAPCDDADPGEDVVLEYSTDGATWQNLATFNESGYPAFTQLAVAIPVLGATGNAVRLRWRQVLHSGAGQDNWLLDNALITRYEEASPITWTPAVGLNNPASAAPTATPGADTWYKAQVTGASGCIYSDSVLVRVTPAFALQPINDTVRCGTAGTQLVAQATSGTGINWTWSPATGLSGTGVPNPVASPATTTTYTVNATNSWGCGANEQVTVAVSRLSTVSTAASDGDLCHGESVDLSAVVSSTGTYSLAWSPANAVATPTLANTTATPSGTTSFVCTATDALTGCQLSSSVLVNVRPAYALDLTPDTTVCTSLGMQLHATHNVPAPFQATWSPAANLNASNILQPTILVDNSATYVLTLTDGAGCTTTDSTQVTVAFENLVTPVSMGACHGESLVLDAGYPGSTYAWNTNATDQSITVSQTGQYTVTITDVQACQVIKTFNVVFDPLPVVDLGPDLQLCGQPSYVIDAGNTGNTSVWNTGSTAHQLTVNASGTYSVTVTTPQGCQATDAVQVALNALPVDVLQDVTSCVSQPVLLDAGNAGATFLWNTGETTQAVAPAASGGYSVTVTTPQQCSATFDAQVTLMPLVQVDLGPDLVHCEGEPVVLDPGPMAATFLWNNGATSQALTVQATGNYILHATNGFCADSDTAAVLFNPSPVDTLTDQTACIGQTVSLDAGNAGAAFSWSTGSNGQSISVQDPGSYSVEVTTDQGCVANLVAEVGFVPPPLVDLGADTVLCAGQLLLLNAGNPGLTYAWSTGSTAQTLPVGHSGTFSVAVDNGFCSTSDEVTVRFNPAPVPMPVHQFFSCLDDDPHYVAIDAGNPGSTFLWDNGQHGQVLHATGYGWQRVTITNAYGCSLTDSALVDEFCRSTLFIPNTFTPNGDGRNDLWLASGNNIAQFDVHVFDRWGGVLFHATDVGHGWDGTANGGPVPNDVYVFQVVYRLLEDGTGRLGFEQTRMGHVQVLR